jgi:hypothetical protein
MAEITFEAVLRHARQLPLADQARLTSTLERERSERLTQILDAWAADESEYEDDAWPELRDALDETRDLMGMRRLFDG